MTLETALYKKTETITGNGIENTLTERYEVQHKLAVAAAHLAQATREYNEGILQSIGNGNTIYQQPLIGLSAALVKANEQYNQAVTNVMANNVHLREDDADTQQLAEYFQGPETMNHDLFGTEERSLEITFDVELDTPLDTAA